LLAERPALAGGAGGFVIRARQMLEVMTARLAGVLEDWHSSFIVLFSRGRPRLVKPLLRNAECLRLAQSFR
jgi:hypothetical protein